VAVRTPNDRKSGAVFSRCSIVFGDIPQRGFAPLHPPVSPPTAQGAGGKSTLLPPVPERREGSFRKGFATPRAAPLTRLSTVPVLWVKAKSG